MIAPIVSWTPSEPWAFADAVCQALTATAPIEVEHAGGELDVTLAIKLTNDATVVLTPKTWWRAAWVLLLERDGESHTLAPGQSVELGAGEWTGHLRRQRRALVRELDGATVEIALDDPSFHRFTRRTETWWEVDLGRGVYVARVVVAAASSSGRIAVVLFGYANPAGDPPASSWRCEADVVDGRAVIEASPGVVARIVRVEGVQEVPTVELDAASPLGATLLDTMTRAYALFRDRVLVVEPRLTYGEVWTRARALAPRLPGPGAHVGLVLRNGAAWLIAELACLQRGCVTIPISPDEADDRFAAILGKAKLEVAVCEARDAARLGDLPTLSAEGGDARVSIEARDDDALWTVLFTSGSSGTPKGAMRTFGTFHAMVASYNIGQSTRHLSFQPLSHLSERMYLPALIAYGVELAFSRGGAYLADELRTFAPEVVGGVPRLFEVIHAAYQRRVRANPTAEAEALAEARGAFGDRLQAISVGSAPVSAELEAFLRRCFADVWVTQGYGSTEVGTITVDGVVQSHVEVKLDDRGEIWVKSPHRIAGYLGDPDATAAALDADGFWATGDLGERDASGKVRVVGRLASSVKLAHGEFVSAERIELAIGGAELVDRVFVHAEPGGPGVVALVWCVRCTTPPNVVLDTIRAQARAAGLAAYEVPRAVIVVEEAPTVENGMLTVSGKLARGVLKARYGAALAAAARGHAAIEGDAGDLRARVQRAAAQVLGRAVALHEPLDGAVDSLAAAEILAVLSQDLGHDVPLAAWFAARDLDALAAALDGAVVSGGLDVAEADRAREVTIAPREARPLRTILVTGATGFLGAHLVEALVARTSFELVCLVRAPDDAAATARLRARLAGLEIAWSPRIRAIAGDVTRPPEVEVEAILHAAAQVSWLAPYAELRAANVEGTLALLALGLPLHFVSTISTAPVTGDEASRLTFADAARGTPYGLSKWIAEDHVRRAGAAGLPVAIYRPAMIAGHSTRGHGNPDDYLHRYLAGVLDLGRYVDREDARIDFTPVDFVASAIVALIQARPHGGDTWHLANVDQSPSYAALGRALAAAGAPVAPARYAEFRAALAGHRGRLHALAAFFPEDDRGLGMGPWPCARTVAALADLGVHRPPIDDAILRRYLAFVRR